MKATCVCCRFFSPKSAGQPRNECRRRTPESRRAERGRHDELGIGVWPIVSPDAWCGEFESRFVIGRVDAIGEKVPR